MSRALFSVVPQPAALPKVMQELARIGVTSHNVSTLRFETDTVHDGHRPKGRVTSHQSITANPTEGARTIHATGQLRWALLGASATGATRRVARALTGMGMPEGAARRYQDFVRMGDTLLCVFCETAAQAKRAFSILQRSGVKELATTGAPE